MVSARPPLILCSQPSVISGMSTKHISMKNDAPQEYAILTEVSDYTILFVIPACRSRMLSGFLKEGFRTSRNDRKDIRISIEE